MGFVGFRDSGFGVGVGVQDSWSPLNFPQTEEDPHNIGPMFYLLREELLGGSGGLSKQFNNRKKWCYFIRVGVIRILTEYP